MSDWSDVPVSALEDNRFLNRRLAYFGKVHAVLSFSFMVLNVLMSGVHEGIAHTLAALASPGILGQLGSILVSVVLWLLCRGRGRGPATIRLVDGAALFLMISGYAWNAVGDVHKSEAVLVILLATQTVVVIRAVIVPSSARRTLWVSALSCVPVLTSAYLTFRYGMGMTAQQARTATAYGVLWCALIVAVATLASRIIFGLRQKVRDAAQIGQYTLEEKIGEGGMGTVYRARHALLRRATAIKLLPRSRAGAQSVARFEREVQHTSHLTHPNTVAIYDYGHTADGVFYYAMEYLDGVSLEELVELEGAQPAGRVTHVLRQLCGALAEAHARGLVHRDVKPANVLLCVRGDIPDFVKVLDFGLVKALADAAPGLSVAGAFVGTPLYIAPEALRDAPAVTGRADIYGVGAVAYFLLTGSPPFKAATSIEVCSMHLYAEPVPPSSRTASVPASLDALVLRCLAKDPAERPSAPELASLLGALPDVPPWTDEQARRWWEERAPALTARVSESRRAGSSAGPVTVAVDVRER